MPEAFDTNLMDFAVIYESFYDHKSGQNCERKKECPGCDVAGKTTEFVKTLVNKLEDRYSLKGYYEDRDLLPGQNILNELHKLIKCSKWIILVLSPGISAWKVFCGQSIINNLLKKNSLIALAILGTDVKADGLPKQISSVYSVYQISGEKPVAREEHILKISNRMAQSESGQLMDRFPEPDADQMTAVVAEPPSVRKEMSESKYRQFLKSEIVSALVERDIEGMKFLMQKFIPDGELQDITSSIQLFEKMEKRCLLGCNNVGLLVLCLEQIERKDLSQKTTEFYKGIPLWGGDYKLFSETTFVLHSVSKMLTSDDLQSMKFLLSGYIKGHEKENIDTPLQLFLAMLKKDIISETDLSKLKEMLAYSRKDIVQKMNDNLRKDYLALATDGSLGQIMANLSINPEKDDVDTVSQPMDAHIQHPEDDSSLGYPHQVEESLRGPPENSSEDSWDGGTMLEYMDVAKMKEYCSQDDKDVLGSGGFGYVLKGAKKYRQREVAIKVCQKAKKEHELQFMREKIVGHIRHPFLMPLYAVATAQEEIYLMYPYMEKRDLDYVLMNEPSILKWFDRCRIIYQVSAGLEYLHTEVKSEGFQIRNSILHMDIKPHNILLDENLNARLGDHGLATEMKPAKSRITAVGHGAPIYQDPDFISKTTSKNKYCKEYDVFSVGVVMLRLMRAVEHEEDDEDDEDEKFFWTLYRDEHGKCCEVEKVTKETQEALPGVWPVSPEMFECTKLFAGLALKCIVKEDRISLDSLQACIKKDILEKKTFVKPNNNLCCKCSLNSVALDLHPRIRCTGPGKEEVCTMFCQDCLMDHYRNPLYCPTHGLTQPPIGHDNSFAILVCGLDKEEEKTETFKKDVQEIREVLINPNIMGFRKEQVYTISCNDASEGTVLEHLEEKLDSIKNKTSGHPEVTIVFFYSGHGGKDCLQPLPGNPSFDINKKKLEEMIWEFPASDKLIILDCCYAASTTFFKDQDLEADGSGDQRSGCFMEIRDMYSKGEEDGKDPPVDGLAQNSRKDDESLKEFDIEIDSDSCPPSRGATEAARGKYFTKHEPSDSDNLSYYVWSSCSEHQKSVAESGELSIFTKHLVNGLKSSQECGLQNNDPGCKLCTKLQREASVKGYISFDILHSYVYEHVKMDLSEDSKIQQPEKFTKERRPMKIAYYNKGDLYQTVLVFTPKEDGPKVIKLKEDCRNRSLSATKEYIAKDMIEKGWFPSGMHGEHLFLVDQVTFKEIDCDDSLQQATSRNFPLHCYIRTGGNKLKLKMGPIVHVGFNREKLLEWLEHLTTATSGTNPLSFKAEKRFGPDKHYTITFCEEKYQGRPIKLTDERYKSCIDTINCLSDAINSIHEVKDKWKVVTPGAKIHIKIFQDTYGNTQENVDWLEITLA